MIQYKPIKVLFKIGSFTVFSWGTMLVVGFLIALFLALRQARKQKIDSKHVYNIALILLLGSIIGARVFHVFENLQFYINKPIEIFAFSHGGLTSYGAFLSLLFVWIYVKKQGINMLGMLDFIAPYLALAIAITRIGCFLNWCCYGQASSLPWALKVNDDLPRHPTQLYESAANFLIFYLLIKIKSSRERLQRAAQHRKSTIGSIKLTYKKSLLEKPGFIFFLFLTLYSLFRFSIDFLREYSSYSLGLALSQWIAITVIVFSVVMMIKK